MWHQYEKLGEINVISLIYPSYVSQITQQILNIWRVNIYILINLVFTFYTNPFYFNYLFIIQYFHQYSCINTPNSIHFIKSLVNRYHCMLLFWITNILFLKKWVPNYCTLSVYWGWCNRRVKLEFNEIKSRKTKNYVKTVWSHIC